MGHGTGVSRVTGTRPVLLLGQALLWGRAIPRPTGRAPSYVTPSTTGARPTADRDAAWPAPREAEEASAPMGHAWTWGRRTSSGDLRGGAAPSRHVTLPGGLAASRCWRVSA